MKKIMEPPKGANLVKIALARFARILMEKSLEGSSPRRRSQRQRFDKKDELGSYKRVPLREYVGMKVPLVLNKCIHDVQIFLE